MKNSALEARCLLAQALVYGVIGLQEQAANFFCMATEMAQSLGFSAYREGTPMPPTLLLQTTLEWHWREGFELARDLEGLVIHWFGNWKTSTCGVYETKPLVAESKDGFMPGLICSRLGAEAQPSYQKAVATLEDAIKHANLMESDWHLSHDDSGVVL